MTTTKPKKNKLAFELSPYLQQHATNPVHWYPWGDEAFIQAKQQDKPVFLSIGYATCHWCHVMAHESFEDDEVAQKLNDTFICIKVDREERPDLDNLYMKVCQILAGSGGWPLTIIMTPEKKPFFAATYLPKTPRFGQIGLLDLISRIQQLWRVQKEKLIASGEKISTLLAAPIPAEDTQRSLDRSVLDRAYEHLLAHFDEQDGGFSAAPKFPTPHHLFFLLRYWNRTKNAYALTMVERTLQSMRFGGLFDQVGYGFHRYATDQQWNIPHFEKMLYDQALLILAYTEAYQVTHNPLYKQVAQEIITYVLRDMKSPTGGFYTAEDADSESEEGKYYTWTSQELQQILSPSDFHLFTTLFSFTPLTTYGTAPSSRQPHRTILFCKQSFTESAKLLGLTDLELQTKLRGITTNLYQSRKKRIPPLKDDKILSDWNGLVIAALAKAGIVFHKHSYVDAAEMTADFLTTHMIAKTGRMLHRFRNGEAGIPGFADDYAFTIFGLLELYQATFNTSYLRTVLSLNKYFIEHFWDERHHGFFFSEPIDAALPRTKEWYDGALPCANSVSIMNLLRLSRLTGETRFEEMAQALIRSISTEFTSSPVGYTYLLTGVDFALGPSHEIVVVGEQQSKDTRQFLAEIHRTFLPHMVVILLSPQKDANISKELFPFADSYRQVNKKTTVYVCSNHQCHQPVTSIHELKNLLH